MNNVAQIVEKHLPNVFVAGWAAFLFGISLFLYYAFFEPFTVTHTEVYTQDIQGNLRNVFHKGEPIVNHRKICKSKNVTGVVDRELVDMATGSVLVLGTIPTGIFEGCYTRASLMLLPTDMPLGVYEYRTRSTYMVNPLRHVVYISPTSIIELIP